MITTTITTVSDLRFKTNAVLAKASKEPVVIYQRNQAKGILLSVAEYEKMRSDLEDYYDAIKATEYAKEPKDPKDWISEEDMRKELGLG